MTRAEMIEELQKVKNTLQFLEGVPLTEANTNMILGIYQTLTGVQNGLHAEEEEVTDNGGDDAGAENGNDQAE